MRGNGYWGELEQGVGVVVDAAVQHEKHLLVPSLPALHQWQGILNCPGQTAVYRRGVGRLRGTGVLYSGSLCSNIVWLQVVKMDH